MMGLMPWSRGALPEVEGAEKVAVVRRGERGHAQPLGLVEELPSRAAPSSIEYSVWLWRWTKESLLLEVTATILVPSASACAAAAGLSACAGSSDLQGVLQVLRVLAGRR